MSEEQEKEENVGLIRFSKHGPIRGRTAGDQEKKEYVAGTIRCKNCKHWDQYGDCTRIVPREKMLVRGHYIDPGDPTPRELEILGAYVRPDVPSYPANLNTHEDFGCTLAEPK